MILCYLHGISCYWYIWIYVTYMGFHIRYEWYFIFAMNGISYLLIYIWIYVTYMGFYIANIYMNLCNLHGISCYWLIIHGISYNEYIWIYVTYMGFYIANIYDFMLLTWNFMLLINNTWNFIFANIYDVLHGISYSLIYMMLLTWNFILLIYEFMLLIWNFILLIYMMLLTWNFILAIYMNLYYLYGISYC
uniref:Uncharacterized protein n=1 Tax=Capsaspora owczarzaki TaxID=192875 RepID=M1JZE9_9EUKA|nr:hypothetical protein [Capsaspora owczarzaki]